ncbi:MAG: AAA family ATPase [Burkholderiales bacterium]|nr:AAA family ATPase [Burkholderiales bacterium]
MTHNHQTWRIEDLYLSRAGTCLLKVEELQLQRGCLHILMGSNGAGKTSLLRTLHSLEPTGRWSSDPAFRTERQAMVFQKPVFLKDTDGAVFVRWRTTATGAGPRTAAVTLAAAAG